MSRITAIKSLPVDQLRRHPRNVREDLGDTDELASSMVVQGVLQPLLVAPRGDVYVVLDGNRRLAAARQARIPYLPCLITSEDGREATTATMLAAAMHKQLSPLEQGAAFRDLLRSGLTVRQIASRTGYSTSTVRDRLRLDELPQEAKDVLAGGGMTVGKATQLARQVAKHGTGSTSGAAPKTAWFGAGHRLADDARARCGAAHKEARVVIGGIACGQCWEHALVGDAAAQLESLAAADVLRITRRPASQTYRDRERNGVRFEQRYESRWEPGDR